MTVKMGQCDLGKPMDGSVMSGCGTTAVLIMADMANGDGTIAAAKNQQGSTRTGAYIKNVTTWGSSLGHAE